MEYINKEIIISESNWVNKKMIDDVKVILAEYRLALKIYNTNRKK